MALGRSPGRLAARGEDRGPVRRRRRRARRRGARRRRGHRRRRAGRAARARRPAHPPARAGPRGRRDGAHRVAGRGRSVASPRCWRWPTPRRSPTPPRRRSGSSTSVARPAWSTYSRSARSPAGLGGEELAELGLMARSRARVRVFSDDGKCVHDPRVMRRALEYVKAFGGVISQHSQDPTSPGRRPAATRASSPGVSGCPAGPASPRRPSSPAT